MSPHGCDNYQLTVKGYRYKNVFSLRIITVLYKICVLSNDIYFHIPILLISETLKDSLRLIICSSHLIIL